MCLHRINLAASTLNFDLSPSFRTELEDKSNPAKCCFVLEFLDDLLKASRQTDDAPSRKAAALPQRQSAECAAQQVSWGTTMSSSLINLCAGQANKLSLRTFAQLNNRRVAERNLQLQSKQALVQFAYLALYYLFETLRQPVECVRMRLLRELVVAVPPALMNLDGAGHPELAAASLCALSSLLWSAFLLILILDCL